jgi:hypothetical protein
MRLGVTFVTMEEIRLAGRVRGGKVEGMMQSRKGIRSVWGWGWGATQGCY